jgi:hypothetical protein
MNYIYSVTAKPRPHEKVDWLSKTTNTDNKEEAEYLEQEELRKGREVTVTKEEVSDENAVMEVLCRLQNARDILVRQFGEDNELVKIMDEYKHDLRLVANNFEGIQISSEFLKGK